MWGPSSAIYATYLAYQSSNLAISNPPPPSQGSKNILLRYSQGFRDLLQSHPVFTNGYLRALQELLGHKTLAVTQRYSHLTPEQLQNAVKLLAGMIGEKRMLGGQAVV